jgi:hypothetical protein
MAATLIGTVGVWGLTAEATLGIIVKSVEETTRNEKNYIKDEEGFRVGRADFDESIELKISGEIMSAGAFSGKLGAAIVLANTVSAASLVGAGGGMTLIGEVKRSGENEGWRGVEVDAEILPFFV